MQKYIRFETVALALTTLMVGTVALRDGDTPLLVAFAVVCPLALAITAARIHKGTYPETPPITRADRRKRLMGLLAAFLAIAAAFLALGLVGLPGQAYAGWVALALLFVVVMSVRQAVRPTVD